MNLMSLVQWCALCIASGFGSGYSKVAPGTCGSLAALGVWWLLSRSGGIGTALGLVLVVSVIGYVSTALCLRQVSSDGDPSWVVIDEWAGLYLALIGVSPGEWPIAFLAFGLFRFFDASKVGPVGWAETLPGALGVMADDLVAGGLTAIVIVFVRSLM